MFVGNQTTNKNKKRKCVDISSSRNGITNIDEPTTSNTMLKRNDSTTIAKNGKYVQLAEKRTSFNKKFKITCGNYKFKFVNIPKDLENFEAYLDSAFSEIVSFLSNDTEPHFKIGVQISIPGYEQTKPIGLKFIKISDFKTRAVIDLLDCVAQSNTEFLLGDHLEISTKILHIPNGSGRDKKICYLNDVDVLKYKKSLVNIEDDYDVSPYCLPISLLIGKCLSDLNNEKIIHYKRNKASLIEDAKNLIKEASVEIDNSGIAIDQIIKFQKIMPQYDIIIFNDKKNPNSKLFNNFNVNHPVINILYLQDIKHFVAIKSVKGLFNYRYQCSICRILYNKKYNHSCNLKCKFCEQYPTCSRTNVEISCTECNRHFANIECFDRHKDTLCALKKVCNECGILYDLRTRNNIPHKCKEKICSICLKIVEFDHQCYVQKYKKLSCPKYLIVFYDIECTQETELEANVFLHKPILCVANIVCNNCFAEPFETEIFCSLCSPKKDIIFENDAESNCITKFIHFCETFQSKVSNIYCIAHNFRSYDGQFIIKSLMENKNKKTVEPILNGMKILKITYDKNIFFIDSLNFIPFALSKFPKIFGLNNLSKGYYPHFFNTEKNYNYVGNIPDKTYFGTNYMSSEQIKDFDNWYTEMQNTCLVYDNRREMIRYCGQDVKLLREGCLKFMIDFMHISNINPFTECFTLAQACMCVYRKNYLPENTLGVVPKNFYCKYKKQSLIGLKWLIYQNKKIENRMIFEYNLPGCKLVVDGFDEHNKRVFEFLGCFHHGCRDCFMSRNMEVGNGDTMESRFEKTIARLSYIKKQGYTIFYTWECQFRKILNDNPLVNLELENDPIAEHIFLNPRDAVYGGRTETFTLYYKTEPGEKIRYLDYTSLYPYINKYAKNPIGHPKIFRGIECIDLDISNIDGLIKCIILPPQSLELPILPLKINNKLMFVLCQKCASLENVVYTCNHQVQERCFKGTWVIAEIKKALVLGYKILKIYEVWQYETAQYNKELKTGGVFTEYINNFLKIKQESSGWPSYCITETDKNNYIKMYAEKEGIKLDYTSIVKNPSKRNLSKIKLNSLWGKFIQRDLRSHTSVVWSEDELYKIIMSPKIDVVDLIPIEDHCVWVTWNYVDEDFDVPLKHVSIGIGAFTTAYARLKLYDILEKVSETLLYCDTDSVIYVEKPNCSEDIKTGEFLGDLTDEIDKDGSGSFITEFVSTGPKCYAYRTFNPTTKTFSEKAKCKGITLNSKTKDIINFSNLKSIVTDPTDSGYRISTYDSRIKRKKLFNVISQPENKTIKFNYNKRICLENFQTHPFGYK